MWSGQAVVCMWLGDVWVWIKRGDIGNNIKKHTKYLVPIFYLYYICGTKKMV